MPQGRKKTAVQLYEEDQSKRRPPIPRLTAVEMYERDQRRQPATPPTPQPQEGGFFQNIATGFKGTAAKTAKTGLTLAEAVEAARNGYYEPIKQLGELYGRGTLAAATSLFGEAGQYSPEFGGPTASNEEIAATLEQAKRKQGQAIAQVKGAQEARQSTNPAFQAVNSAVKSYEEEAARNPSFSNKVARFIGGAPIEAAIYAPAMLSGAGLPGIAATAAIESAGEPENAALNVALASALPPVLEGAGKLITPILRRIRAGKTVAAAVKDVPVTPEAAPVVQNAIQQFEEAVQRINAAKLTPKQKAAELESAIQTIGREAEAGAAPTATESMVQSGYPRNMQAPLMRMPGEPLGTVTGMQGEAVPPSAAGVRGPANVAAMEAGPPPLSAEFGTPEFSVKAAPDLPYTETLGPSLESAAFDIGGAAAESQTPSTGRYIGQGIRAASSGLRTFKTAIDLSAPLQQGAVLSTAHPLKAAGSFVKMLRSLKKTQSEAIDKEILADPGLAFAKENKIPLFIATGAEPEEMYALKLLNKVPGIKHSERTYRTYLDTLRLSVWNGYLKSLEAAGYSVENNPKAFRQAAEFINIATGRGAIKEGGKIAKAMALGGDVLFAPRNLVAKFQLLDPLRYATLAPGARQLVLKDASIAFGGMLGTALLLKQAGFDVGLNPLNDNFMQAKLGNTRYDLTAGVGTQVKFLARMLAGTYRSATGEGNLPGKDVLSVGSSFARGKLAPVPGLVYDYAQGSDIKGKKMKDKSALDIGLDYIAPMIAADLVEGYKDSGVEGAAKTAPSFFGARVSTYPDRAKADYLQTPPELRAEQKRLGRKAVFLNPKRARQEGETDETPEQFAKRKATTDEIFSKYGAKLVSSRQYQSAPKNIQDAAMDYLERRAKAVVQDGRTAAAPGLLSPGAIIGNAIASENRKKYKKRAK